MMRSVSGYVRIIQWICLILFCHCELVFASSRIQAILVGNDLRLTCNHTDNSQWWFDGKSLHDNTELVNNTLTLEIKNVSIHNHGNYWCGTAWKHGYNVFVIIGNLPSAPRSVHSNSYEWKDTLYWKASLNTGGLPVHYMVKAECPKLSNASNLKCQDSPVHTVCKNTLHKKDKQYNCSLEKLDENTHYRVFVFAINELGNTSVGINFTRLWILSGPMTTPAPPPNLSVLEQRPGNAKLSWDPPEKNGDFNFVYINFSRSGDDHNKTLPKVPSTDKVHVIDNLMANSWYTFYVRSRYEVGGRKPSVLSSVKTVTLHTRDTVPEKPPENLTCSWSGKEEISLSWKSPPKQSVNGKLTHFIVLWRIGDRQSFNKTINASHTNITLRGVSQGEDVTLNIRACNEKSCSGITNDCRVYALPEKKSQPASNVNGIIAISSVTGVTIMVIIIVTALIKWHKRKRPTTEPLDNVAPTGRELRPTYTWFDYLDIENTSIQDVYTAVNNSTESLIM